jgi:flagellin
MDALGINQQNNTEVIMAFSSGARINTNIAAYNALNALNNVNREIGVSQLRLATGKRINSGADDASGYVISKKMEGRIRALSAATDNVGDAQSMLGVAEAGFQTIADLLTQIKDKVVRFGSGAFGAEEKDAIAAEIKQLMTEIDSSVSQTKFNGQAMLQSTAGISQTGYNGSFQVGESSAESFAISFTSTAVGAQDLLGTTASGITSASITTTFTASIDTALKTVSGQVGTIGAYLNRLTVKEANLSTAITNTEAAKSRILDADIAKEQITVVKLQILQQTSTAQLAQANQMPQVFLSLFR